MAMVSLLLWPALFALPLLPPGREEITVPVCGARGALYDPVVRPAFVRGAPARWPAGTVATLVDAVEGCLAERPHGWNISGAEAVVVWVPGVYAWVSAVPLGATLPWPAGGLARMRTGAVYVPVCRVWSYDLARLTRTDDAEPWVYAEPACAADRPCNASAHGGARASLLAGAALTRLCDPWPATGSRRARSTRAPLAAPLDLAARG